MNLGTALLALATLLAGDRTGKADEMIAIEHAGIHTGDGGQIVDGTVIMRGKIVVAVGPSAELPVPPGTRRIDGLGTWITPGFIDAESSAGLIDLQLDHSSLEIGLDKRYDAVRAAFAVADGLNPRAVAIPVARREGVTGAVLAPSGGLVSGRGAVIRLDGDRVSDLLVTGKAGPFAAVYATLALDGREAAFGARGGVLLRLRELIDDVRQYASRRADFERNQMRKVAASRLDLEALVPVVEGRMPLVVEAHRASDIQAALALAREEKLALVLTGCEEGWMVAREIAEARVPVIVSALPDLPRAFEALGARLENPALLVKAGVKIAISPRGRNEHATRTIRLEAGNAVANGLSWEAALAAITRNPAEIFGVAGEMGTLAPGKSADLVVWSGDPFEPLTRPQRVFIAGREIPMVSRQTALRDRYRNLRGQRPLP